MDRPGVLIAALWVARWTLFYQPMLLRFSIQPVDHISVYCPQREIERSMVGGFELPQNGLFLGARNKLT
jgi:hypothetical protein